VYARMESGTNVLASYQNVQNSTRARRMSSPGSGERGTDQEQEEVKQSLPWFRVYTDSSRHPKIRRLSDRLHRFWFDCLCLCGENGGVLPSVEDIACYLSIKEIKAAEWLNELRIARLIDETEEGLVMHNWNERQFRSDVSTKRVRAFRKRHETVSETAPDTDTEQIQNRTEQTQIACVPKRVSASDLTGTAGRHFEAFWDRYPRKQRRDFACSQYLSLVTAAIEEQVFVCLGRYLLSDEVARGVIQNPDKWLYEQHRNNWAGDWPKVRDPPKSRQQESVDQWDKV
jgi:hypothetical protein